MSSPARAARRAAERAAAKQARKAATSQADANAPTEAVAPTFAPVKWGRTARTLLLSSEEAPLWDSHLESYFQLYRPVTEEEFTLVGQMAETWWRAEHIPVLVADLYALGAVTFASLFANEPEAARPSLIRGHTHMAYCQRIEKLYLQESRLQRHYFQLSKQLRELRAEREAAELAAKETETRQSQPEPEPEPAQSANPQAAKETLNAAYPELRLPNDGIGFEFSNLSSAAFAKLKEVENYLVELPAGC